jgi:L-fuculose-phosphate aldolase
MTELAAREALIDACRRMNALGINQGTAGNISVRHGETMLISPSATPYETLRPELIAAMPINGPYGAWDGPLNPSSEWRFHLDIMRERPDVGAVVHAHPTFCTALSMTRRDIPPCHYMIASFGGATVRCAPYATFGTADLSQHALAALSGRSACLLSNHGMIACGPDLAKAMWLAVELEALARQYVRALTIGGVVLLSDTEIAAAMRQFSGYGLRPAADGRPDDVKSAGEGKVGKKRIGRRGDRGRPIR